LDTGLSNFLFEKKKPRHRNYMASLGRIRRYLKLKKENSNIGERCKKLPLMGKVFSAIATWEVH